MDTESLKLDIDNVISKLGCPRDNYLISRAIALYHRKGIPLNHVLAEALIAHYLKFKKGFESVDIERSINRHSCDVYAEGGSLKLCVEIEFNFVPPQFTSEASEYLVARHVKKAISVASCSGLSISFAYPRYCVPSIPIDLLRPPTARAVDRLRELIYITRKYFPIDADCLELLRNVCIHSIMIFDIARSKVYELTPQTAEVLITLYEAFLI